MAESTGDDRKRFWMLVAFVAVFVGCSVLVLNSVRLPQMPETRLGTARLGYTLSLLLVLTPVVAGGIWYTRNRDRIPAAERRALWWTLLLVVPVWVLLDIAFAHQFFCFPDESTRLGWNFIGWKADNQRLTVTGEACSPGLAAGFTWNLPIEELLFYVMSAASVTGIYLWAKHSWTGDSGARSVQLRLNLQLILQMVLVTVGLLAVAVVVKNVVYPTDGPLVVPGYTFGLIAINAPVVVLYGRYRELARVRALLITVLTALVVSLIWEATLALPHGLWGYQAHAVVGLLIYPWHMLPIESLLLWLGAPFANAIVLEVFSARFQEMDRTPTERTGASSSHLVDRQE